MTAGDLRAEMRRELPQLQELLDGWLDYDIGWCQRCLVVTFCRELYTLATGTVGSKRAALDWAAETLDPRWRPLIAQVVADRAAWDPDERPPPGSVEESRAFAGYALDWAAPLL